MKTFEYKKRCLEDKIEKTRSNRNKITRRKNEWRNKKLKAHFEG